MKSFRAIVALLIGLAVAVSPVGAAWALNKATAALSQPAAVATDAVTASTTGGMTDCEKMMRAAGQPAKTGADNGVCPCCDTKSACPPERCFINCAKIFGMLSPPMIVAVLTSLRFQPDNPDRPPDWIENPQPPPPRV